MIDQKKSLLSFCPTLAEMVATGKRLGDKDKAIGRVQLTAFRESRSTGWPWDANLGSF